MLRVHEAQRGAPIMLIILSTPFWHPGSIGHRIRISTYCQGFPGTSVKPSGAPFGRRELGFSGHQFVDLQLLLRRPDDPQIMLYLVIQPTLRRDVDGLAKTQSHLGGAAATSVTVSPKGSPGWGGLCIGFIFHGAEPVGRSPQRTQVACR